MVFNYLFLKYTKKSDNSKETWTFPLSLKSYYKLCVKLFQYRIFFLVVLKSFRFLMQQDYYFKDLLLTNIFFSIRKFDLEGRKLFLNANHFVWFNIFFFTLLVIFWSLYNSLEDLDLKNASLLQKISSPKYLLIEFLKF